MKWPRVRFRLRTLLAAILAIGVTFGLISRRDDQSALSASIESHLRLQAEVAKAALFDAKEALSRENRSGWVTYVGGSREKGRWQDVLEIREDGPGPRPCIAFVEVTGCLGNGTVEPITIRAHGAPLDDRVIRHLSEVFRERGWRFKVRIPSSSTLSNPGE